MKSMYQLLAVLLISGTADAQTGNKISENTKNKEIMIAIQSNKEIVQKLYENALNQRNLTLLKDLIADDYIGVTGEKGVSGFEAPILAVIKAFPDAQWKIEELISDEDKVVVKWKFQGTHTGQFQQFSATDKIVSNDGMTFYELKNGKVIKAQVHPDRLGLLQQIDVLPVELAQNVSANQAYFIDKFVIPAQAKQEFVERMNYNRNFIKTLPGFIRDDVYSYTDEQGNFICMTIAVWENEDVLTKAKEAVQIEYKKQGFNPAELLQRLNITMDRGVYKKTLPQKD